MVLDFVYSMQHPVKGFTTFTNDPYIAESYSRAGYIVRAKGNTGNGSKVFKLTKTTRM